MRMRTSGWGTDLGYMGTVPIQNTKSMDLCPQEPDEFVDMNQQVTRNVAVMVTYSGDAFQRFVAYPVIVEAWDRVGRCGSKRRKYNAAFTEAERRLLTAYHGRFYRWYLVSGSPRRVACRLKTLQMLKRAVDFFASI